MEAVGSFSHPTSCSESLLTRWILPGCVHVAERPPLNVSTPVGCLTVLRVRGYGLVGAAFNFPSTKDCWQVVGHD